MYQSRKRACRISWRKGEPLGLEVYPTACFLDIPREIRDRIYYDTLTTSRSITVSSVTISNYEYQYNNGSTLNNANQTTITRAYTIGGKDPIFNSLAANLLTCHPVIAAEAGACFYQSNIFHFDGNEVWNPLYSFLQRIGDYNRSFLRNLSLDIKMPHHPLQDRYGARVFHSYPLPFNIVHSFACAAPPQTAYRRQTNDEYYACQYIDPAIQACFRLLGADGPPVVLKLNLQDRGIPGAGINLGPSPGYTSLPDLPDFVESLRQEFAQRVDVLWKGIARRDLFVNEEGNIQEKRWEIVVTKEEEQAGTAPLGIPLPPPLLTTHFTLRRKLVESYQTSPTFCESCYIQHSAAPLRLPLQGT